MAAGERADRGDTGARGAQTHRTLVKLSLIHI